MAGAVSETFKITSPIVSEVGITVTVQPNDDRLVLNVGASGYLLGLQYQ